MGSPQQIENKLGTHYQRTDVKNVEQSVPKSLRSNDGSIQSCANNSKVLSSNLPPQPSENASHLVVPTGQTNLRRDTL